MSTSLPPSEAFLAATPARTRTVRDVARVAGVSPSTVSNALNRPHVVAPETLSKIEAAITELGFVRNATAQHLRQGRSTLVGLVMFHVGYPFFADVARGIEEAIGDSGHVLVLSDSGGSAARERNHVLALEAQRVAGVIVNAVGDNSLKLLAELHQRGSNIVLLGHEVPPDALCSVSANDRLGGALVADHFLDLGHERVALINAAGSVHQPFARRRQGYLERLSREGVEIPPRYDVEVAEISVSSCRAEAEKLLNDDKPPTAIFCGNDIVALGAMQAALSLGRRVPRDVAIVGYDDLELASLSAVPLTSVRQPRFELGRIAGEILLSHTNAPHRHRRVVLDPTLVVRKSTV